jgi:protein-L-isoaspartate(D-aspartate) O-methyltransferase
LVGSPTEVDAHRQLVETMLRALQLTGSERVLEIGSTSAYEAALLARQARQVVSLVSTLEQAQSRQHTLSSAGHHNVKVIVGKSAHDALADAPYQAVFVAAAAIEMPVQLLDVLAADGRIVIALGNETGQVLQLVSKRGLDVHSQALCPCHLPMLHGAGGRPSYFPWNG